MVAIEYVNATESAAIHLFSGIDKYFKIIRETQFAAHISSDADKSGASFNRWASQNKELLKIELNGQRRFLAEVFALNVLCGSVLQLAHKCIDLHTNPLPRISSAKFKNLKPDVSKYCIGREVSGVPLGLVIYAGRVQHTHFDDENLSEAVRHVFKLMSGRFATSDINKGEIIDPAFDLTALKKASLACNVLQLLEWHSYDSYKTDMFKLLEG